MSIFFEKVADISPTEMRVRILGSRVSDADVQGIPQEQNILITEEQLCTLRREIRQLIDMIGSLHLILHNMENSASTLFENTIYTPKEKTDDATV